MEYVQIPNVLLEAMVILGSEANGFGQAPAGRTASL